MGSRGRKKDAIDWMNPRSVFDYLGRFVIAQDDARVMVSTVMSNYVLRVQRRDWSLPRQHMMIIGPTGSGKSLMMECLAGEAKLPWVEIKLTSKTVDGFTGDALSNVFRNLISQTRGQRQYAGMERCGVPAPPGVIFFDEVCKIARSYRDGYNFSSELQDALIGWGSESGDTVTLDDDKHEQVSTSNLLIVVAGAFERNSGPSLDEIVRRRLKGRSGSVGALMRPTSDDLIRYGLKPEFVGRYSTRAFTRQLTVDQLEAILTGAENSSIAQYSALFEARGYDLEFASGALRAIAERAPKETGARALNELCSRAFNQVMFYADSYAREGKIVITPKLLSELLS